jgi:glycosyltransferase involved in cell wall biosynthesis
MSKLWFLGIIAFLLSLACLIIFGIAVVFYFVFTHIQFYFGYIIFFLMWPLTYLDSFGFLAYFAEFSWIFFLLGVSLFILGEVKRVLLRSKKTKGEVFTESKFQEVNLSEEHPQIAVVIPAYNEESRVGKVIETTPKNIVQNIIVIDDNSTDNTIGESLHAGATVLRHSLNRGVGAAIKTGYREALRINADIAIVVAGDGQHDPTEIPNLIEPILKGEADYVVGERLSGQPLENGMPRYRYVGNRFLSFLTSVITDFDVKDAQCGYTAISKSALKRINLEFLSDKWGFPNDMLVESSIKGLQVKFVPIRTIYGTRKSYINLSKYIVRVATLLFRGSQRKFYFRRGIYIFNLTALFLFLIGLIYGIFVLFETLRTGVLFGTGSVVLVAILILSSFQLVLFGFLSDLIKMIESKTSEE